MRASLRILIVCLLLPMVSQAAAVSRDPYYQFTAPEALPVLGEVVPHNSGDPVALEAEEMGYDKDHGIVVARGKVEIAQGPYVVLADQVTYYKNRDVVVAEGHVSMLQPNGDVFFADRAELRDSMKTGAIDAFKARMMDNSVMAANVAHHISPSVTKLDEVVYSPCKLCRDMAPFWQITAGDATVDQGTERVKYHDASIEMLGVPLLYTPYLSHPTPDATAKSGLLTPEYKSTTANLGSVVKTPYYWRISEDKEATITPWYSSTQGMLLQEDYRQLTDNGTYRIRSSQTNPSRIDAAGNEVSGNQFRGHIYAEGQEKIDEQSRIGFDINRTTDDTYLRRYGFGGQDALFSKAYIETAQDRNFASAQGLLIQGMRLNDNPRTTPAVFPMLQGYYETPAADNGIRYHLLGDAQSITREQGVNQRRVSVTPGASLPIVTDGGHIITTSLNLRQDFYNADNVPITGSTSEFSGTTVRTLPQAAMEWRYPLMQQFGDETMTLEPIVLGVAQNTNGNPAHISNEDNTLVELNDTNLFSLNRMPGLDTVDRGSRVAYGVRSQYLFAQKTSFDTLLGQDYNADSKTPFPNSTRPGENFSDYIGRVGVSYDVYSMAYRFALVKDDFNTNRNEIVAGYGRNGYALNGSYRSLDKNHYLSNSKEAQLNAVLPFSDEWSLYGSTQRNVELNIPVYTRAGLIYKNDCFNLVLDALRTYSSDRDIMPNTQFTLRFGFKNLGEFGGK